MLVDGGRNGQDTVLEAIRDIPTKTALYNFHLTDNKLKFDVVIITHWDKNHWTGVLNAMKKDIESQSTADPDPKGAEVSFFKYTAGAGADPRTPDTVLYAPSFGWPTKSPSATKLTPKPKTAAEVPLDFGFHHSEMKKQIKIDSIVKGRVESDAKKISGTDPTIVGTNVITGNRLGTYECLQSVKDPTTLTTKNKPDQTGQPGIYIIAASQHYLGPDPHESAFVDTIGHPVRHEVGIVDILENNNEKNESSVACMIIWPGAKENKPARLSHFFAGDLHYEQEKRLVSWTGADGKRDGAGSWVPSVKASHHGSKSSTPVEMLQKFNPRTIVGSVGQGYGHPSEYLVCTCI